MRIVDGPILLIAGYSVSVVVVICFSVATEPRQVTCHSKRGMCRRVFALSLVNGALYIVFHFLL